MKVIKSNGPRKFTAEQLRRVAGGLTAEQLKAVTGGEASTLTIKQKVSENPIGELRDYEKE